MKTDTLLNINQKYGTYLLYLVICTLSSLIAYNIYEYSDIIWHNRFVSDYAEGRSSLPSNFFYYLSVYVLSFGNQAYFMIASLCILGLAVLAKFVVTEKYLAEELKLSKLHLFIAAVSLLIIEPLPSLTVLDEKLYLGNFFLNVWHNSTTMFVMPFALMLFWISVKQLDQPKNSRLWLITLLILANVAIKPSFLFVYIPVFPFMLLYQYKFSKQFWLNVVPIFIAVILVALEYIFIFESDSSSSIAISPGSVYASLAGSANLLYLLTNIAIAFFATYTFPIITIWKNRLLKQKDVIFAIASVTIGLFLFFLLIEAGPRAWHGNFGWQIIITNYILFMVCIKHLLIKIATNGIKKHKLEISVFVIYVISGLVYLTKTNILQSYI